MKQGPPPAVVPAVDDDGSGVWNGALCAVDLLQEPEDATRLVGHPVVRPAQVLIVPDVPHRLLLQQEQIISKTNYSCVLLMN